MPHGNLPTVRSATAEGQATLKENFDRGRRLLNSRNRWALLIIGRVQLEAGDETDNVRGQMEMLPEGYFATEVDPPSEPVGFRLHGYEPYDLRVSQESYQPIIDVGVVRMSKYPESSLVPVTGRIFLEEDGEPVR